MQRKLFLFTVKKKINGRFMIYKLISYRFPLFSKKIIGIAANKPAIICNLLYSESE